MLFGGSRQNSDNFLSANFLRAWPSPEGMNPAVKQAACVFVWESESDYTHYFLHNGTTVWRKAFTTVIVSFIPGLKLFVVWLWLLIKVPNNLANKWQCDRDHRQRGIMSKPSDHNLAHRKRKSWLLKELDFYLDTFVLASMASQTAVSAY